MKVTITRQTLLSHLKSMVRVVPKTNQVIELKGILIECDEDDGHMKLTATNLETTIQRRFKVNIEESGSVVVAAVMFHNIISLLSGEEVVIKQINEGLITITGGSCTYTIPVINARNYPSVPIPFPGDTLKIKGICTLYSRTSMATANVNTCPTLSGIHLDIYSDTVCAVACDAHQMAMTEVPCECGGKLSVTIPTQPFYYLANAVNDSDVLEIGVSGSYVVFMKEGMVFATKYISGQYLDIDTLTEPSIRKHVADIKSADLKRVLETVSTISSIGGDVAPVEIQITKSSLDFKIESEEACSKISVPAEIKDMEGETKYYPHRVFATAAKVIHGDARLEMSSKGMLYLSNEHGLFMTVSSRQRSVKKKKQSSRSKAKKVA